MDIKDILLDFLFNELIIMNENIDLTKILKDCPKGWKLYSPLFGEIEFSKIGDNEYSIIVAHGCRAGSFTKEGFYYADVDGECLLFPSKDQRNWSKFNAPWYKKEKDTIARLEKQDEQKEPQVYETEDGEIITYSETDGYKFVEPNFHEGDWVVRGDTIARIVDIQEQYYVGFDINGKDFVSSRFLNSNKIHLWTINDAKDGDVVQLGTVTAIFKKYIGREKYICYCSFCKDGGFEIPIENGEYNIYSCYNATPATKEQRDLLFQKIKEVGYKWNTETNTFEKLVEPKFDPKTLKPFDKVLIRDKYSYTWVCGLFSHISDANVKYKYRCVGYCNKYYIPYNDETKHLVGTTDEAPKYYRYWEN